jgi:aminoglycoside 6'-N-acetyltransferase I
MIRIRAACDEDSHEWLRMRRALWADCPDDEQTREIDEIRRSDSTAVYLAERPGRGLCGFLEVSIRPWADGCTTMPVGYLEGWYVDPDVRRQGVGRALVEAAEQWARSKGCRQMGSDTELWNKVSHQAHAALGYVETLRHVLFKKNLD